MSLSLVSVAMTEARAPLAMEMQLPRVKLGLEAEVSLTNSDSTGALKVALLGGNHAKKVISTRSTSIQ